MGRRWGTGVLAIGASVVSLGLAPAEGVAGSLRWQASQECSSLTECKFGWYHLVSSALFTASAGESNRLSVAVAVSGVSVRDVAGAVSAEGEGCRSIDAQAAECDAPNTRFGLLLGDGDDTARFTASTSSPGFGLLAGDGGPGADQLSLASDLRFPHVLIGGEGSDTLTGSGGEDVLADAGTGERDVYRGGANADMVSYKKRPSRITVTLGSADGNEDLLSSIESLVGGSGDDVLRGDGRPNTLQGGPGKDSLFGLTGPDFVDGLTGADRLEGGGGGDVIRGGPGADDLRGGPGADLLDPGNDGQPDRVRCGPGRDRVLSGDTSLLDVALDYYDVTPRDDLGEKLPLPLAPQPTGYESPSSDDGTVAGGEGMDKRDLIGADCEVVELSSHLILGTPRRSGRRLLVRAMSDPDYQGEETGECLDDFGTPPRLLVLRAGRRILGRAKLPPRSAKNARTTKIQLNRLGRRIARHGRTTTISDYSKHCSGFSYRTRVR